MSVEILADIIEKPISGEWGEEGNGISVLRTTNFNNDGTLNLKSVVKRKISESKLLKKKLKYGDIIIEKSGGSLNQPVGRVVYFNLSGEFLCNNFTSILRPKKNVFPKFLFYFLFANHKFGVTGCFQNKTTGILNLQLDRYLKSLQIPLPPLSEQKRIAAILDKADALRKKTREILEQYDLLAQSIFLEMFGDPVKNPKGWETKTIQELVKTGKYAIKRGPFGGALKKEIFVESGILVYEQYHALNNDFDFGRYFIDENKFAELKSFEVKPGDIIISCSGVYLGKLAIIPQNAKKGIINQALLKISLDESKMPNVFFLYHFTQKNFKNKFFDSNRGAGIPNFPPMIEFKKFPFIAPPIELQNKFATIIQNIEKQKALAKTALQESEDLFQALLQSAFSKNGETNI